MLPEALLLFLREPPHSSLGDQPGSLEISTAAVTPRSKAEDIARGIFTSVSDLARKLRRYINAYSANARAARWKYSDPTRRVRSSELTTTGH
jgi:hypothetical protein